MWIGWFNLVRQRSPDSPGLADTTFAAVNAALIVLAGRPELVGRCGGWVPGRGVVYATELCRAPTRIRVRRFPLAPIPLCDVDLTNAP